MATLKCKEYLCLLYSTLLFISGIILISVSVVLVYKVFYHFTFVPAEAIGPYFLILFLGLIHLWITWLAVKGVTKEHDFHIILYITLSVLLLLLEMGTGIWANIIMHEVPEEIDNHISGFMTKKFDSQTERKWFLLQEKMHCCGRTNVSDYLENKLQVPDTCFINKTDKVYKNGCKEPFTHYIWYLLLEISLCGYLSALYQVLGIIVFIFFYQGLKKERVQRAQLRRRYSTLTRASRSPHPVAPPPASV